MSGATLERPSVGVPDGRQGLWWFLGSEIATFGGVLACYSIFRLAHPQWAHEASHTVLWAGTLNTIVLLTSSLFVVFAHHAAHANQGARAARFLWVTLLLGVVFLCIKGYEYSHEIQGGHVPTAGLFWAFYFLMTGLHALHVIGGLVAIGWISMQAARGERLHRVEVAGIYWHFVDVVWIFLFPLLYIAS